MRLYSLTNYYLSSIQKGIQTAHLVSELSRMDREHALGKGKRSPSTMFREWADHHKTIILLNGGNSARLGYFHNAMISLAPGQTVRIADEFPVVYFREDEDSLNGALTAVGVILPESVYKSGELLDGECGSSTYRNVRTPNSVLDQILTLPLAV